MYSKKNFLNLKLFKIYWLYLFKLRLKESFLDHDILRITRNKSHHATREIIKVNANIDD